MKYATVLTVLAVWLVLPVAVSAELLIVGFFDAR